MAYSSPATVVTATTITSAWGNSVKAATDYLANPPACRVYNNANISINDNAITTVTFNAERFKTIAGMHSNVTNTNRITFTDAGIYQIGFHGTFANGTDYTHVEASLWHNGSVAIGINGGWGPSGAVSYAVPVSVYTTYKFAANDYIEVRVYQDNTANTARNLSALGNYSPEFYATWIGLG